MKLNFPKVLCVLGTLLLVGLRVNAAVYYSRVSGTFSTKGNWSTSEGGSANGTNLQTSDSFIILSGHNMTLSANQTTAAVTIRSGGTLTLANRVLTTGTSSVDNSGSIVGTTGGISRTTGIFTNRSTGTMSMSGVSQMTMGTGNFVNENTSASVNFGGDDITVSGTAQSIGGFTTTGAFLPTNASGTITVTGNISAAAFTKSGAGTINLGAGLNHTFTGIFSLGTAGTVNGGSSTININVVSGTAFTGTGTVFVPGTSTIVFGGNGNQTVTATGTESFYNLTYAGSGIKTMSTYSVANILEMEGTATASAAPTFGTNSGLIYNTSNNRTCGLEWVSPFTGTQGVSIAAMNITTNGSKIFNDNIALTINSGATLSPASGHTFSFGGDLINQGTWSNSDGAVTITGTDASQNIGRFSTTGLVTISKSAGTATFTANINGGAFTLNGSGTLNLGAGLTHDFTGNWTNTTGSILGNSSTLKIGGTTSGTGVSFTAGTGTVDFDGTAAQNIPLFNYNNLTVSGARSGATVTFDSGTIGIAGTFLPSATSVVYSLTGNTVAFNGAVQTVPAFSFNDIIFSGGDKIIESAVAVNNVEIQTGPTLNINPPGVLTIN